MTHPEFAMGALHRMRTPALYAGVITIAFLAGAILLSAPMLMVVLLIASASLLLIIVRPEFLIPVLLFSGGISLHMLTGGERLATELGGIDVNGIKLVLSCSLLLFLLVAVRSRSSLEFVNPGFVLFLGFAALSILYSGHRFDGIRVWAKLFYPFLIYLVALRYASEGYERLTRRWALAGGLVVSAWALIGAMQGFGLRVAEHGSLRLAAGGFTQSPYAYYMLALSIISLAWYLSSRKPIALILFLIFALQVFFSVSRIAAFCLVLCTGILVFRHRRRLGRIGVIGLVTVAISWAFQPLILNRMFYREASWWELLEEPGAVSEIVRTGGRLQAWGTILEEYVRAHPLIGSGLGSVSYHAGAISGSPMTVPHNEYLRLVAETGLVGLSLFIMAWIWWAKKGYRLYKTEQRLENRVQIDVAFSLGICYLLIALVGNPIDYYAPFSQFVFCYLALALSAGPRSESTTTS